ncbi:MAG TPA: oxygenase MpaB family protein [Polyangiaceae bacterium]|nr:oxygenase MpaB family protein [Polyangiaceae bacterium]
MFPTRFVNVPDARARFGDRIDRLGAYLTRADPLADAVIEAFAAMPPGAGWALFRRAASEGIARLPEAPGALQAFFAAVERVPLWVDDDLIDRGGAVLVRAGALGGIVLGMKSLVLGYASPVGNKPLVLSGRLEAQAGRRLNETARFVQATIAAGGMRPRAPGWQLTLNVRLIHAQVRRMIHKSGAWNAEAWGAPINQHDELGTSLLFSVVVLEGLRQLGMRIAPADGDAYMHLWRWSGWLMGLDPEILPATEAEGRRLGDMIAATQAPPDEDSRRLTDALLGAPVRDATTLHERTNAERLARFSRAMCRFLIGDVTADRLGVEGTSWSYVVPFARRLVASLELVRENVPFGNSSALWAGTRYWDRVIAQGLAGAAELKLPDRLARAA